MTTFIVNAGVTSGGVTLGNGDFLFVSSGGTADATTVNNGGTAEVLFGGVASTSIINSKGTLLVSSGGVASDTTVTGKSSMVVVSSGGVANGTNVKSKGNAQIASGGVANFSVLSALGVQSVAPGGVASGTVVDGGSQFVLGGATFFDTISAGNEYVSSGGLASGTVVSAQGKLFVFSGSVTRGVVLSGGYEYAFSAGVAIGTVVDSGSVIQVQPGGLVTGAVVYAGGQETVLSGGIASGSVFSGGFDGVFGGVARDNVLSGADQYVSSGGVASGTVARGAGATDSIMEVLPGGVSVNAIMSSGGQQVVESAGVANGTIVRNGGTLVVNAGGTANFTVVSRGGSIDLTNLNYVSGGSAVVNLNGLLTVIEGLGFSVLQLAGSYNGAVFQPGPEPFGGTGTMITLTTLGNQNGAPRTLSWTGALTTVFGIAADWSDLTNGLISALAPPNAADTVEFLAGGGPVTGSGTAAALAFGGTASWQVTSSASLSGVASVTVGQGGTGTLLINNGASITGLGASDVVAGAAGATASVTVDGTGSLWESTGALLVGSLGSGSLTVSNGASVRATETGALPAMALGANGGGSGALLVTGPGSTATLVGELDVGKTGAGTITVSNQGTLLTGHDSGQDALAGFDIARLAGGSGDATVTGPQSLLSNLGRFVIGDAGLGHLHIAAGATVITAPNIGSGVPGAVIANSGAAAGSSAELSGAGSNWRITGLLDVGAAGAGSLLISNGAMVTADSLDTANIASSIGQIGLTDAGTQLIIANAATVADDGIASLSVLSGATFSAASLTIGAHGNSSGAVIVSGAGSTINLSGALNIGTTLGTGGITVGPGAAVHASVVNLRGTAVLDGGLLDPTVQLIAQGQTASGFGTIAADFIVNEGMIQASQGKVLVLQGTVLGGGVLTVNGAAAGSNPVGELRINAGGTMQLSGAVMNAATTTISDGLVPAGSYTVNNSAVEVSFAGAAGMLVLDDIAGFGGTIATFHGGNSFVIPGGALSGLSVTNGHTLTVSDHGTDTGPDGRMDQIIFGPTVTQAGFSIVNGNTVQVACFAEGTRIETMTGLVAIEELRAGDEVRTLLGGDGLIIWAGSRHVDCTRHPAPETVWPIRIARGALGENMPARTLFVSPDHAIYIDGVLIPAKHLVNGMTIRQEKRRHVIYHHIELARHDVVLAEGLPAETYLDTGDRAKFHDVEVMTSRWNITASTWETSGCAELVVTGPRLHAARGRVNARAAEMRQCDAAAAADAAGPGDI